jgi:LysM repeat protein
MKQSKRLFFFLLLNVFVSACTTLAVLVAWDQLRGPLPSGLIQPITINLSRPAAPEPTSAPTSPATAVANPTQVFDTYTVEDGDTFDSIAQAFGVSVDDLVAANGYSRPQTLSPGELLRIPLKAAVIDSVIGAGDLDSERVIVLNNLDGELNLGGWQLEDNRGRMFTFPQVTLFGKNRAIEVYTRSGVDSADQLYWGLLAPVWQPGMAVTLRDAQGAIQATFTVP